jgi:hypothetical protein
MALQDFWLNLKAAARFIEPKVLPDPHLIDPGEYRRISKNADLWLTPATVEGFDVRDFHFLPPQERAELKANVEGFRIVAEHVPASEPAKPQQMEEALSKLGHILEILQPDLFPDVESFRIASILRQMKLPETVVDLKHEFGIDSSGEPAVWIWVVLQDAVAGRPTFFSETQEIRERIKSVLRREGVRRWPYIRFRTASEQQSLNGGGRE